MANPPPETPAQGVSRRHALGVAGAGAAALSLGGIGGAGAFAFAHAHSTPESAAPHDFFGPHQSGIVTTQQDHLHFAAFDVTATTREELVSLLRDWTEAASALMAGMELGSGTGGGAYDAPPDDTGEALDLPASGLTVTFGLGRSLFDADGKDRFGIASQMPDELIELPHFPGDTLNDRSSGGDLCIQACATDPQVATHAIRNLARIATGRAAVRWAQLGFGRTSSTSRSQHTPRNLMGFKDGTNNLTNDNTALLDENVWVAAGRGPAWMTGGSYLVVRKIRILTDTWDRTALSDQERLVGRTKRTGAPLSGGLEFTPFDFDKRGADSEPLVPHDSHVALSHPTHSGVRMLRRGFNYTDGADELGRLQAGLFFLAYVARPEEQFVAVQRTLSRSDMMLVEYTRTIGSALFAVPPGLPRPIATNDTRFIGDTLFA